MKFRNCESYLYGKDQLLYFQEIRDLLKYQKPIEFVFKLLDKSTMEDSYFPPLYNFEIDKELDSNKFDNNSNNFSVP